MVKKATSSAPTASASKSSAPAARASTSSAPPGAARATRAGESALKRDGIVASHGEPSHDQIAERAFELYLQRGGYEGSEMSDWLRAESELRTPRA